MLRFYLFIILLALFVILTPGLRPAQASDEVVHFVLNKNYYYVEDQRQVMDAVTFIENDRIYVPIRYLGESLGAKVDWNGSLQLVTLTKEDKAVYLVVGMKKLLVHDKSAGLINNIADFIGKASNMEVAPLTKNGRTYLPARFVAEAFGYTAYWDKPTNTATISKTENFNLPPVPGDPYNPPTYYIRHDTVIDADVAQRLFGPLVPPNELIGNGTNVALKYRSRDIVLNPDIRINPVTKYREIVGGRLLENYLSASYDNKMSTYKDENGNTVESPDVFYPLKDMMLLGGFPKQNIFWNDDTQTMVIYGSYFHHADKYTVIKIVAGQETKPGRQIPAPMVENGQLLVSDAHYNSIVGRAFGGGTIPTYSEWLFGDLGWFSAEQPVRSPY